MVGELSRLLKPIEAAAIHAHRRGVGWGQFWRSISGRVGAMGLDGDQRRALLDRLLHLVITGEPSGQVPPGAGSLSEIR